MRYLIYSHDTYGLGHFRRCSLIASGIVDANRNAAVLIVTGSPRAQAFDLPHRIDTVNLPSITKDRRGRYRARKLGLDVEAMVDLRSGIIGSTIDGYRPDVILVDHAPLGMGGELRPVMERIARTGAGPRVVLGLRDVIDEAGRVDAAWHRDGTWDALAHYDEILVYGDERIMTTADELALELRSPAAVTHTGYVAPTMPKPRSDEPFLLVTPGGGGDGHGLVRRYLDAVDRGATAGVRSIVVTGPLLSSGRRAELLARAAATPSVELIEFTPDMRLLIASAVGVVSMAGYNTVVEELTAGTPSLLVPRRAPRLEQHLRAHRLAVRSQLRVCQLEALEAGTVADFVQSCDVDDRRRPAGEIDLGGVRRVVELLGPARSDDEPMPPERSLTHV